MLIALLADVHANREALEGCLAHARARRAERFIFLGDHVGYGADPEWVVDTIREHVSAGAVALLGNHDVAASGGRESMNAMAEAAIEWTRGRLDTAQRRFLAALPLAFEADDCLFVHADASAPTRWYYVTEPEDAMRSMRATRCRMTFCGHVHRPAVYSLSDVLKMTTFRPVTGVPVPLLSHRRWFTVLGSVGQPRDGNPAAAYAMLDTGRSEVTFFRVPYDVETTAAKIRTAGLPEMLADRLRSGH
jgi:diadenosine tetraphosphatase ApaH/serine/threonine PP2A family protein phosphatase